MTRPSAIGRIPGQRRAHGRGLDPVLAPRSGRSAGSSSRTSSPPHALAPASTSTTSAPGTRRSSMRVATAMARAVTRRAVGPSTSRPTGPVAESV